MSMWNQHSPFVEAPEDFDFGAAHLSRLMGTSDYLAANVGQGFDDSGAGVGIDRVKLYTADPNKRTGEATRRGRHITFGISPDALSEEEWTNSEHYREALPFDKTLSPLEHAERARQYDERRIQAAKINSYEPSALETIAGFGGQMLGASASPETFLPVGGGILRGALAARAAKSGWSARAGAVASDVGAGALEGLAGSAMALPFVAAQRDYMGDPMSHAEMAMDLALSAFGGAALSGIGGAVARKLNPDLWTSVYQKQRVVQGVARAQQAIREGDLEYRDPELDGLLDNAIETAKLRSEEIEAGDLFDRLSNNAMFADGQEVRFQPNERETYILTPDMVRDVTRIGQKGYIPPYRQLQRKDLTALPEIVRTAKPENTQNNNLLHWVVQREDGERVLYQVRRQENGHTYKVDDIRVLDKVEYGKYGLSTRAKNKDFPAASSRRDFSVSSQDTNQEPFSRPNGGRQGVRQDGVSEDIIAQEERFVEIELDDMRNNGGFTPEEAAELEAADADVARAEAVARGLEAGALCVAKRG